MRYVLAYDVVDDRRRTRLFKRLKRLMTPAQKSVFEGDLSPAKLAEVERLIHRELNLQTDAVRVYTQCRSCAALVKNHGISPEIFDPDAPLVVGG